MAEPAAGAAGERRLRLAIYHNLGPGGALRAMCEYALRLAPHASLDVYHPADAPPSTVADDLLARLEASHPVHRVPLPWPWERRLGRAGRYVGPLHLLRAQRGVAREIDAAGYDAVFVHPCRVGQSPAVLRHLATPSVYYMQEPRRAGFEAALRAGRAGSPLGALPRAGLDAALARADRSAATRAHLVLANSAFSVEAIARSYGLEATFCPLGVDEHRFTPGPGRSRAHQVLVVGALVPHKAQRLVVEAVATLAPDRRPAVVLAFDTELPAYRAGVEQLAASEGVALHLRGSVSEAELAALYRQSALTCATARLEPFGLTVLESLSSGTPVVAVREGGFREVVQDGVNGRLTDRDAGSLGRAVEDVLAGGIDLDPARIRATVVPGWSWDRATATLLGLLRRVADAGPRRP